MRANIRIYIPNINISYSTFNITDSVSVGRRSVACAQSTTWLLFLVLLSATGTACISI